MRKLNTLLLTVVISGVVSRIDAAPRDTTPKIPQYQQLINSWIGNPVSEMLKDWGAPDRTLTIMGKEYAVYAYDNCTYTFEVRRGIIVGGNAVDGSGGCKR